METYTSGRASSDPLPHVLPGHADVPVLEAADHHEIKQIALQREHDVFLRPVVVLAAQARGNLRIIEAVRDRLQVVVRLGV